ncbi:MULTISPECIES: TRAP transporter substrate-binding protein [Paenibacillus]|uniref:C4-dicarboxylate ABC transporter n=1 Tax=Paenibacillus naphthalenovorans TaxID=162209 RepID=A0A0U2MXU2_9BACL|nr:MULTISPECIES: TRAP transporter substrate-binding protein [Paenibacillus]ALS23039.1 C4-dicarboxylate ABC transporter [Paenibacillus naphthalenovorans]GCL71900.1 TRAP transporter substrate-binding protein [Paenibacillus naphthalenovorans]SDI42015.1 tripartite ATP-independent transporter solute receptor, DctP family [Paenibacillus naphthalenovorans]
MKSLWKKAISGLVVFGLLISVIGCGGGQNNNTTVQSGTSENKGISERKFKLSVGLTEDHPEGVGGKKFKEIVEKNSGGKFQVNVYFNNQLGDDKKVSDSLQSGTVELGIISTSPLTASVKEFGIFDLPFIFNNEKEADAVLDGTVGKTLLDKLPAHNLIGLGYWENGFRNLTNSKKPVATLEDFKGLKIRTIPNQVHLDVFKALGANPTPMPFSELFTAMESKTIDGQENPLTAIQSSKFYEVQSHLSLSKHLYTPFIFMASKKFWDKLNDQEKKILQDAVIEAGKFQRELNREETKKSLEYLKNKGMQVSEFSNEETKKIQEAVKPVIDKYSKELGEELVKKMFDEIQKVRGEK